MEQEKPNILNSSLEELEKWISGHGAEPYRGRQVFQWLYQKGAIGFDEMTDLPAKLRAELKNNFSIHLPSVAGKNEARDGTTKFLFELFDHERIEAVLIPEPEENTLCVSVQVGCKYGCEFCYTATIGFKRSLQSGEIVGQYLAAKSQYPKDFKIHRMVIMGMGEALDNFEELERALNIFKSRQALGFSPRRITVSTAGVAPKIPEVWKLGVNLAISLNAADNAKRLRLMPIAKKYPVQELAKALRALDTSTRQKLTAEYVMLKGMNDSLQDADRLAMLLSGLNIRINLIRFNAFPGCEFDPSDESKVLVFQDRLKKAGFLTFIRKSKGREILAACGQLAGIGVRASHYNLQEKS